MEFQLYTFWIEPQRESDIPTISAFKNIFTIEAELHIVMFSVAINGLKAFSTLQYKNFFIEQIAMVQSSEHARISASEMSAMRVM